MSAALALALALVPIAGGVWSPDPEQALLGRTRAAPGYYQVSTGKSAIIGEQALLGRIGGKSASAVGERNGVTAGFALLGR